MLYLPSLILVLMAAIPSSSAMLGPEQQTPTNLTLLPLYALTVSKRRSSQAWTAGQWLARKATTTTSSLTSAMFSGISFEPSAETAGIAAVAGALSPTLTTLLYLPARAGAATRAKAAKLRIHLRMGANS